MKPQMDTDKHRGQKAESKHQDTKNTKIGRSQKAKCKLQNGKCKMADPAVIAKERSDCGNLPSSNSQSEIDIVTGGQKTVWRSVCQVLQLPIALA